LANKVKDAYPILFVLAGLFISLISGMAVLHIEPDLI